MSRDRKYSIQLVVEGNEEEYFFKIVEAKGLSGKISLSVKNAGGFGNIASYYQSYISNDEIDVVFAVYDVDYRQNEEDSPFRTVRKQLLEILGYENSVNAASLCTNPNILQLFLLAKDTVALLFDALSNPSQTEEEIKLKPSLVERKSVRKL